MKTSISLAFFIALASAGSLQAQTVWRCGEGGTLYSDRACADGRPVTVADARSSTDVAEARATAAGERAFAERLVHDRMAREASALAALRPTAQHMVKAPKAVKPAPAAAKAAGAQRKKPPKPFTVRLPKQSA
jgi:hypothetical protein